MKALLYLMALTGLLLLALPMAGCETLTDTQGENISRVIHTVDTNGKEIPDDVEGDLLYINRPSWLSVKPVPNE